MKFKEKPRLDENLLKSVFLNAGVNDINLYINPTHDNDTKSEDIPNIHEALKMFLRNIGKEILILVDSDADGFSSAAVAYKYVKIVNPLAKVRYFIHKTKTHGLTEDFMEYVHDTMPDMIIIPDAATNDIEQREIIVELGIDLLIIDHHNEDETTSKGGILINNHANFPENDLNKNMTGSGMTYLVCKAFDELYFNTNQTHLLKDLAMIGLIGDGASLLENETRCLCLSALRNITSKMIKQVIASNNQSLESVTFTNMQWGGIVPIINAVVRIGNVEEKELIFKSLTDIEADYFRVVQKRKLNKETRHYEMVDITLNSYELAIEAAQQCRVRQNEIIEAELKLAKDKFDATTGIQIYVVQTNECKGLTGYLANKLISLWEQPVIAAWIKDGVYTGSLRGHPKVMSNFKKWCEDTELFEFVQGHDNAAGVGFKPENLEKIRELSKKIEVEEPAIEVHKVYDEDVPISDIELIGSNRTLFANGVMEPLFGIKNFEINAMNAKWSKNTLRIYSGGVTFIKFKVPEADFLDLVQNNRTIDMVGHFGVNMWNGRRYPQFEISQYEIVEPEIKNVFQIESNLTPERLTPTGFGIFA